VEGSPGQLVIGLSQFVAAPSRFLSERFKLAHALVGQIVLPLLARAGGVSAKFLVCHRL